MTSFRIAFAAALLAAAVVGGAAGFHFGRPAEAVEFLAALKWCHENVTYAALDTSIGTERARLVCAGEKMAGLLKLSTER